MKKVAIIPTLFTLGNAVCGFAAIACAGKIDLNNPDTIWYFALSGWLIIAAMIFDALDGYVARLSKTASKFGGELDSLCDGISFGLAPAFLLLRMGPGWERGTIVHQILAGIAALYMSCALLRLARFNVESTPDAASHKRFRGLPSPGAAGCLASLAILRGTLADNKWITIDSNLMLGLIEVWAALGALLVALLMVSRVPYPHATKQFVNQSLHGRRHFSHLIQLLVLVFILALPMIREVVILAGFWVYALGLPARYLLVRALRPGSVPSPAASGVDDVLPH